MIVKTIDNFLKKEHLDAISRIKIELQQKTK